jgi:hypothetical protein
MSKSGIRRGEMAFIFAIVLGLILGILIKRVRLGILLGLIIGGVIVLLGLPCIPTKKKKCPCSDPGGAGIGLWC